MSRFDFKEVWQKFYDEALEVGMDENEAGRHAHETAVDYLAAMADDLRDRMKEERIK